MPLFSIDIIKLDFFSFFQTYSSSYIVTQKMSGYVKLPTNDASLRTHRDESDVDDSRKLNEHEECASFADNEDTQESPLIGILVNF